LLAASPRRTSAPGLWPCWDGRRESSDAMTGADHTTWRLIDTGPLSGLENMAVDEAMLSCFHPDRSPPTLRIYGWEPPAFSCGRFQKPEEILDLVRCRTDGIPVVRRITGGGVIYHADELTYSLVCPAAAIPDSRSVKAAFFHLTSFLLTFYQQLGLSPCHAVDHHRDGRRLGERTALCFAGTESCDILLRGRKIGGNAQRRLKETVFQHGSIPLRQMAGIGAGYLLEPTPGLLEATTSLADEGILLPREKLAELLADSFSTRMNVSLVAGSLTEEETEATAGIMQDFA
ncbi:MAG TPA: lipoate--protein ligase family protein, partial [Geobacteraceae bacterium]|nr:lipoate--protein ligase family protein [Geobacteraceae bacterium]